MARHTKANSQPQSNDKSIRLVTCLVVLVTVLGLVAVFKAPCGGELELKLTPPDIQIKIDRC